MSAAKEEKTTSIWDLYKEEDFIDAKDSQGDWRVGYIIAKLEHLKTYKVHFDGWSAKYDQNYKHNSLKLRPFRTIVIGYTGQMQNAALREEWKFSMPDHVKRIERMKSFAQQPEKHTVHDLNQLLRGHNYLYSDFLVTNKFQNAEEFAAAIEFFEINIVFLAKYLSNIVRNFAQYFKVIADNQQLQLWNIHEAYFKSYFQVFDTAYIIWGSYARNAGFFRENGQLIKQHFKETKKQGKKVFQYHITKLFIENQGIQTINEILNQLIQTEQLIPFLFLHSFTNLLSAVYSLVSTEDKDKVIAQVIKIAQNNLAKLKDTHLKQLHKHQVTNFFVALISISAKTTHEDTIQEWTSERELQFSLKLITCPYFDKKLKGIAYLVQICQKSDFILKNGCFKRWSEKVNLFEVLFASNDNQQFARKACELIKFLYLRGNILEKDIDLILAARIGKHETVLKQIYTLISEIALYENSLEQKLKLYNKIAGVPQEEWDDDYIHMIRQLSQNCYGLNYKQKLLEPFGFYMVYRYAVRAQSEFSLVQLSHILHRVEKSKIYNQFQEDCFQQIATQNKTWVHIKILLNICHNRIDTFDKLQSPLLKIIVKCITDHSSTAQVKVVEDGLELLTEVAKNTTKQMEVEQVAEIWKHLIKSDYREIFMRWLFKKKDNGRITLNHSLNQGLRKYLLQNLWNQTEEIKKIDENQAFFFVQLFKSVNISELKMSRVNIVIRPISFDLEAYPKLWNVLRFNTNEEVTNLFCDLLAQMHTCFQTNLAESIQNLVETIALNIRDSMQNGQISFVERMLKLSEKLINRDEQIFPWSHVPRMNYYREYTVHSRENGEEKVLRFNCMSTFYQFKKLISEKFNIALHRLQVFNSRQQIVKLESYFKTMNELMLGIARFQITEDLQTESIVKTSLNHKLDLFFELLDDKRIEKLVWSIVERLPISDELKFKLIETEDLLAQLNKVGFYKELYQLKVVTQLSEQWWQRFVSSANLAGLVENFGKVNFKTHIELEYADTLTEIIQKMLNLNEKQVRQIVIDERLAHQIFNLLKLMLNTIQKDGSKSIELQIKIIKNLFLILQHLKNQTKSCLCQKLVQYKQCENLITLGLIKVSPMKIRKQFYQQMKILINEVPVELIQAYLQLLLGKMLPLIVTLPNDNQLKEYFQFTSYFLSLLPSENISTFILQHNNQICKKIFELIKQQQPEESAETPNMLLSGCLSLLKFLAHSEQPSDQLQIAQFLIHKCLFAQKDTICKSKQSRSECFGLLRVLICLNSPILQESIKYLCELHKSGQWRTKKLDDWTITLLDKMKSPTGYVGIKNLGCICYMNSFMQQLFMVPRFRCALTSCEEPSFTQETQGENLLYQVQKMFLNLWTSDKKFYTPQDFCYSFKDYDGNPTNVTEQMDIDEFSNILFDRLENQMRSTNHPTLIKDMFGGVFSNQIVCKGCPHYSETEEHFLSISLTVKNKKNIYQSLDTMIKGDTLDGDNAYFCERCNKKVSAVKRVSLKKLPDYLIVTLKRFQFDYEKMMKLKVNEYCQFPKNLNLKEYSQQFLRKQQRTKAVEEEETLSNEYFSYVLKGVVVHLGYADSGHYYSYIQDRNTSKWFEFNDTTVRDFNIDDLAEETFGGETSGYEAKQKIKNAYMLIYQRQKKTEDEKATIGNKQQILTKPYNQSIMRQILTQNRQQKIQNILFSEPYHRFVDGLIDHLQDFNQTDQEIILKYIITVYLTISVRQKSEGGIYSILKKINAKIQKNYELKEWIVSLFSQKQIFDQFFKNCIIREVKKLLSYWLVELFLQCNRDCQQYFCNNILTKIVAENQNTLENSLILYEIAKKNGKSLDYLVKNGIVGRYLENIVRKDPRVFVHKLQLLPEAASEIGNEIVFEKSQSEASKKLKLDNENGYVWGLINLVITRSRQLNLPLQDYITPTELSYLKIPDPKIMKILEQTKNKFQMYQFINLLCFLSTDNREFLAILTKLILQGLKQFQSKRYRQFFILFEKLISVQDELKQQRLQAFRNIQQGLIHNEKYSLDSNIIQQWIIILINRNQNLRNHIQNDSNVLNFLLKGCSKKIPSEEVARKNNVYSDFMINKLHGVKFPRTKKRYYQLSEDMTNFYSQLADNTFEESHIWPSVKETETADIKVGDVVAYFDLKDKIDYEEAKVESIFMSRLELSLKKNRVVHLWKDDEKISLDIKFVQGDESNELNSSRTTEMEIEDQQDYFDEL